MTTRNLTKTEETPSGVIPVQLSEAELVEAVRRLSPDRREDLLDKLQELREPVIRSVPASRLDSLTGLVSLGGDALADTEALYDGNGDH
jgi:hypothetical protein